MSRVCKNCGANVENNAIYCNKCGNPLSVISYCSKHGIPNNSNGECDLCKSEGETAAALSDEIQKRSKSKQSNREHKITNILLNKLKKIKKLNKLDKTIFILIILCIFAMAILLMPKKYKKTTANMLAGLLPQKQVSAYVLFQMKNIEELQVLKLNKAEFYRYEDEEKKWAELIIRYTISINFNLKDYKTIKKDDGSYTIELKKPEVKPSLLDGIDYTEKKEANYYPGVEVFDISNSWIPGPDFKMGDLTVRDIAQSYIENECNDNLEDLTQMALENFRGKLMDISKKLNLNITDVRLEGDNE